MAYATEANIVTMYGQDLLDAVASRDGSGRANPDTVTSALEAATAEIDTYLGVRYTVPLDPVPPYIRQVCVDIAVYRMALDIGPRTEEMRVRYADAIAYLKNVAEGKFELPDTSGGGGEDPGGGNAGTGARVIGAKRG
jgi:phage gp36-like protein